MGAPKPWLDHEPKKLRSLVTRLICSREARHYPHAHLPSPPPSQPPSQNNPKSLKSASGHLRTVLQLHMTMLFRWSRIIPRSFFHQIHVLVRLLSTMVCRSSGLVCAYCGKQQIVACTLRDRIQVMATFITTAILSCL